MSVLHHAAAVSAIVAVVVDGTVVPSAPPATIRDGRVVGPLDVVARFADRIERTGDTITVTRGERTCTTQPLPRSDPALPALVPLAALARCLGGQVAWDAAGKSVAFAFGGEAVLRTLPPFDPSAPQVAPTTVFTPEPARATPRAIATGVPQPRRTPIPAVPSWPVRVSSPGVPAMTTAPTTPRP